MNIHHDTRFLYIKTLTNFSIKMVKAHLTHFVLIFEHQRNLLVTTWQLLLGYIHVQLLITSLYRSIIWEMAVSGIT